MLRDFFIGFIKIHILHHAEQKPVYGLAFIQELARHGYTLSPGTLHPVLHTLEKDGYLASENRVVSTFTLGTIPDVMEAIRGIGRVLRPGGKLIFFELTLSPDPQVQRWQKWWEPIHHRVFEGLYLTRDMPSLIMHSGFKIEQIETGYLAAPPKSWTYCCWGTAIPQSQ